MVEENETFFLKKFILLCYRHYILGTRDRIVMKTKGLLLKTIYYDGGGRKWISEQQFQADMYDDDLLR